MNGVSVRSRLKTEAPWMLRVCKMMQQVPEVAGVDLDLWEGGVRVGLDLTAGDKLVVDVRERDDGGAFAQTRSLSLLVRCDGSLSEGSDQMAKLFAKALSRVDKGGLTVPKSGEVVQTEQAGDEAASSSPDGRNIAEAVSAEDQVAFAKAHAEHAELLQKCAFLALNATLTEDLYPHGLALGAPISEEEILASWKVTSQRIKDGTAPQKLGVYIHIPFCTVECSFCYCGKTEDFTRSTTEAYMDMLIEQIRTYGELVKGNTVTSVYIGGGTPSLLTPVAMRRMFTELYEAFDVPEGTQVIFEGNPDSLKPDKVEILGTIGRVTRLTIGVQTLDPEVQKFVRRYNKKEDIQAAIEAARAVKIPHVNFDCIAGLDGQTMESWQHDVNFLLSLQPDTLHMNGFRPLPRTRYAKAGRTLPPEHVKLRDEMVAWGTKRLEQEGFGWFAGQSPRRTANAANVQLYDLRRQNSSLIGLGFPARSHSFGGYYYYSDAGNQSVGDGVRRELAEGRKYTGVPADDVEEMHKFIVTNIRAGFVRAEFTDLFGIDAIDALPEVFYLFRELGVVSVLPDRVVFHTGDSVQALIYRYIAASQACWDLAWAKWGHEFDPDEDYDQSLRYLLAVDN